MYGGEWTDLQVVASNVGMKLTPIMYVEIDDSAKRLAIEQAYNRRIFSVGGKAWREDSWQKSRYELRADEYKRIVFGASACCK